MKEIDGLFAGKKRYIDYGFLHSVSPEVACTAFYHDTRVTWGIIESLSQEPSHTRKRCAELLTHTARTILSLKSSSAEWDESANIQGLVKRLQDTLREAEEEAVWEPTDRGRLRVRFGALAIRVGINRVLGHRPKEAAAEKVFTSDTGVSWSTMSPQERFLSLQMTQVSTIRSIIALLP